MQTSRNSKFTIVNNKKPKLTIKDTPYVFSEENKKDDSKLPKILTPKETEGKKKNKLNLSNDYFTTIFINTLRKNKLLFPSYKKCINDIETTERMKELAKMKTVKKVEVPRFKNAKKILLEINEKKKLEKSKSLPRFEIEKLNALKKEMAEKEKKQKEKERKEKIERDKILNADKNRKRLRNKRMQGIRHIKEYINANGFSLNNFLELNPIRMNPYDMKYGEEFIEAVKHNQIDIAEGALKADPNLLFEHDYMSQTAFHWAAKLGYSDMIEMMFKYGRCCNLYDRNKRTPLYFAVYFEKMDCIRVLLENGAKPEFEDINGVKPADLTENWSIKEMLEDIPKRLEIQKRFGNLFGKIQNEFKQGHKIEVVWSKD